MKRSAIKRRPLADSVLKSLEPEDRDYQELDSPGLYIRVKKSGTKSWLLRYKKPDGKWAWMGIGGFPQLPAKAARKKAAELLEQAAHGADLRELRDGKKPSLPFKDMAEEWYQRKIDSGKSPKTTRQMRLYLDSLVLPAIGSKPLTEVTRADCTAIQETLENREAFVIARKVRGWLNQIFSLAIGQGKCDLNPASELRHVALDMPKEEHYPHLLEPELPEFLQALSGSRSRWNTLLLIRMVLRTACRPGMARWAEWNEIDFEQALWKVPAHKMKMRSDFIAPLARQTMDDLREMHKMSGRFQYVFPGYGPKNPVMSENTINKVLSMVGYKGKLVGHGARHTASTLLREHRWDKDLVDAQLSHKEGGTSGVYNQARYIELRREMMQWYADYLDGLEDGSIVPG